MTPVITKMLAIAIGIGIAVLGPWLGAAAPAGADPDAMDPGPNPFSNLRCECRESFPSDPADSPAQRQAIEWGIREGLSAWLPGLPEPARRGP